MGSVHRRTPARIAVAAWLVLLALLPLGTGPITGRAPYISDIANTFHPLRVYSVESLARGEIPWWNPHTACGVPHATDPQVAFWNPVVRVLELFDPGTSISIDAALHLFLAAALTYLAVRARGGSRLGGAVGAAAFVLGAYVFAQTQAPPPLRSVAFTPGLLLGAALHWSGRVRAGFLCAAGSWCLALFGGHPQFPLCAAPIAVAVAWGPTGAPWRQRARALASLAGAVLVGTLAAGVAMAPGVVYSPDTQRAFGFSEAGLRASAIPPIETFRVFFVRNEVLGGSAVAVSVLLLCGAGLAANARASVPLLVGVAFGTLAAWGTYTPFGELLRRLPPWSFFHYAERYVLAVYLAIPLLAAEGIDAWSRGRFTTSRAARVAVGAWVLVAVGFLVAGGEPGPKDALRLAGGVVATVLFVAGARRSGRALSVVFVALATLELAVLAGRKYWREGAVVEPAALRREPAALSALPREVRDGTYRAMVGHPYRRTRPLAFGVDNALAHFPLYPLRLVHLAAVVDTGKPLPLEPLDTPMYWIGPTRFDSPLLDVYGVGFASDLDVVLPEPWRPLPNGTFERDARLSLVAVVPEATHAASLDEAASLVADPRFDPARRVVVEGTREIPASGPAGPLPRILVSRRDASGFEVTLEPGGAAWLYAAYNHLPGFHCRVDGVDVPVRTANIAFMAVPLAPGARVVEFRYRPPGFLTGVALTASGLVVAWMVARRLPREVSRDPAASPGRSSP